MASTTSTVHGNIPSAVLKRFRESAASQTAPDSVKRLRPSSPKSVGKPSLVLPPMSKAEFFKGIVPGTFTAPEEKGLKYVSGGFTREMVADEEFQEALQAATTGEYKSIGERYPEKPKKSKPARAPAKVKPPLEGGLDKNSLVKLYVKLQKYLIDEDVLQETLPDLKKLKVEELRDKIGRLVFGYPKLQKYLDEETIVLLKTKEKERAEVAARKAKEKRQELKCQERAAKQYVNEIYPLAVRLMSEQKAPFFLPVKVQQKTLDPETKEMKKIGKPFVEMHIFRLVTMPTSKEMKLEMRELIPPTPKAPKGWENKSVLELKRTMVSLQSVATVEEREDEDGDGKNILECRVTFHAEFEPTEDKKKFYGAELELDWEDLRDNLLSALGTPAPSTLPPPSSKPPSPKRSSTSSKPPAKSSTKPLFPKRSSIKPLVSQTLSVKPRFPSTTPSEPSSVKPPPPPGFEYDSGDEYDDEYDEEEDDSGDEEDVINQW